MSCNSLFGGSGFFCKAIDIPVDVIKKGFSTGENIIDKAYSTTKNIIDTTDKVVNKTIDKSREFTEDTLDTLSSMFKNVSSFLKNPVSMVVVIIVVLFLLNKFLK